MAYKKSKKELEEHLELQLKFLKNSSDAYDNGFKDEYVRIATVLRVLLHDTHKSKSLLGQLGKKNQKFVDTALPYDKNEKLSHVGLAMLPLKKNPKWVAMLDDAFISPENKKPFEEWWNAKIIIDKEKRNLSRKDLVLNITNTDGGAHVDPELNEDYAQISRKNSLGWNHVTASSTVPVQDADKASIRQIGHEVLKTLLKKYSKPKPKVPTDDFTFSASVAVKKKSDKNDPGRNDLCPCGSGKKYKYCHLDEHQKK